MSDLAIGIWSFPVLLLLIFARVPIGLAMFVTGFGGLWLVMNGPFMAMARLKTEAYTTFSNYSLTIVPMFLLMGYFATLGGMSQALFRAAEGFLGHRRGGVAMAAVGACAGFGAICGSSLATAATMSRVALPELKRYGYSGGFSTATLAAGGTLGAGVLGEDHGVAFLDGHGPLLAVIQGLTLAHGDDLALNRLFLGGVRDVEAAFGLVVFLDALDHDAVVQRTDLHGAVPSWVGRHGVWVERVAIRGRRRLLALAGGEC